MTRREQILKLAEFTPEKLAKEFFADGGNLFTNENSDGGLYENDRLMPLITAMADRIQELEGALEDLIAQAEQYVVPFGSIRLEFSKKDLTTPTALDALLKGE